MFRRLKRAWPCLFTIAAGTAQANCRSGFRIAAVFVSRHLRYAHSGRGKVLRGSVSDYPVRVNVPGAAAFSTHCSGAAKMFCDGSLLEGGASPAVILREFAAGHGTKEASDWTSASAHLSYRQ
jgi:hypothetical protein